MSEEKEKELTPIELEDQMFQIRHEIEIYEDKKASIRRWQSQIDEDFDIAQSKIRQLDHYDLTQSEVNYFMDLMQRQNYLRQTVTEQNQERLKRYNHSQESLEDKLVDLRRAYDALFETKKTPK